MPHKKVVFERWQVVLVFLILLFSFVIMGVMLRGNIEKTNDQVQKNIEFRNEQIALIQRSRINSCQRTYRLIKDLVEVNVEEAKKRQGGRLTPRQRRILDRYFEKLDPQKCVQIIQPPKAKPKEKK